MLEKLIIVDPIFRGSRMYFSSLAFAAAREIGLTVDIVTRTEAVTDQMREMFGSTDISLHQVVCVSNDFWYGKIPPDQQARALSAAARIADGQSCTLYFPGLNEQWPDIVGLFSQSTLRNMPALFVEYHPEFLLTAKQWMWAPTLGGRFRQYRRYSHYRRRMLKQMQALVGAGSNVRIAVLDERVVDPEFSRIPNRLKKAVNYLVDPAPQRAAHASIEEEARNARLKVELLLVGSQSARKGLREIIRLCNEYPDIGNTHHITLVGHLTAETENLRQQLLRHTALITWVDDYVSEPELVGYFDRADYVLLPYSKDFNGSSGVLGTAVAQGTPVIVSDHGLVGYRTRQFDLGYLYPSGGLDVLHRILKDAPARDDAAYRARQLKISAYADKVGERRHIDQLIAQFSMT